MLSWRWHRRRRRCRRCRHCLLLVGFVFCSSILRCELLAYACFCLPVSHLLAPLPCAPRQTVIEIVSNILRLRPHAWLGVAGGRLPVYIYFFYWLLNFVTCQYRRKTATERERERWQMGDGRTFEAAHLNFNLYSLFHWSWPKVLPIGSIENFWGMPIIFQSLSSWLFVWPHEYFWISTHCVRDSLALSALHWGNRALKINAKLNNSYNKLKQTLLNISCNLKISLI